MGNSLKYSYDFKLDKAKIIIEVQGDYWHASPLKYKETDIIIYPFGPTLAKTIWDKDLTKKELANNKGYKVLYLWENEINKLSDCQLKLKLFELIYEF